VSFFMATSADVRTGRDLMEVVSGKAGAVALVVGVLHFGNVWCLNAFRRRALLRAEAVPPVAPTRFTAVAVDQS
jgi:hypothetical protein